MALKQWRNEIANQLNLPHYMICHNSELITSAKKKPENLYDFKRVKGFGELKTQKFADDIISVLNTFLVPINYNLAKAIELIFYRFFVP